MDLRNRGRRVVEEAEEILLLVNPREIKVKLRGRGHNTQIFVCRERGTL